MENNTQNSKHNSSMYIMGGGGPKQSFWAFLKKLYGFFIVMLLCGLIGSRLIRTFFFCLGSQRE